MRCGPRAEAAVHPILSTYVPAGTVQKGVKTLGSQNRRLQRCGTAALRPAMILHLMTGVEYVLYRGAQHICCSKCPMHGPAEGS